MAVIETWYNQDLKQPVKVHYLNGNVFSQDNGGNLIGVNVFDGDNPATLSGSVSASVIRADGATVAVSGTLSGNQCSVTLPQSCYSVPGLISVVVKLTSGSTITTVCAVVANVYRSSTDTVIDPGTIIPDISTLVAEIEAAVATIPADYSALWTTLAPAFSTSTAYVAGQYVTYNGSLYRFTTAHTAGTWNAAHVTAVNVGGELSDLKSEIITKQLYNPNGATTYTNKRWNSGGGLSNATGYNAVSMDAKEGDKILANVYGTFTFFWVNNTATQLTPDKSIIGRYGQYTQYTAPSDGVWMLTIAQGYELICNVYDGIFIPNKKTYNCGDIVKISPLSKPFSGLKYAAVGDSITYYDEKDYISTTHQSGTYCKGYQSYIADMFGFTKINMGYSGQNSNYMRTQVLATDFSDVDIATIMTGMNDGGQNVPIATYKQNLIDMIIHISTDNPYCRIFLLSPTYGYYDHPQGAYPTGGVTRDYADAMAEVAVAYNIPFYDNMQNNGISYQNYSQYMADIIQTTTYAIHPNPEGYKIIGTQVANWMRDLLLN